MELLLKAILREMDTFLEKWTDYMEQAGYLEHTTAKKEDCILSLRGLIEPIQILLANKSSLRFPSILQNNRDIADFLVQTGSKHQARGLKAELFFGCFKTLLHAVEDIMCRRSERMRMPCESIFKSRRKKTNGLSNLGCFNSQL